MSECHCPFWLWRLLDLRKAVRVDLLGLLRRDDADLVVSGAAAAGAVVNWVNVESRGRRLSAQLSKALDEFFLEVIGDVVLFAEENDASLRDLGALLA